MTKNQQETIENQRNRIKELEKLLRRLKIDLNYLHDKPKSSTDRTLIGSRINMIKDLLFNERLW